MTASKSLMAGFGVSLLLGASAILGGAAYLNPASADDDIGTLTPEMAAKVFAAKAPYSPYAGRNFPTRPLFGDTHLHTAASFDAGTFGARITPREAYRLARGAEITASSGPPAKLSRPLDLLVWAAHSDHMGMVPGLYARQPHVIADAPPPTRTDR